MKNNLLDSGFAGLFPSEQWNPRPAHVCLSTAPLFISLHLHRGLKPHIITYPFVKHNHHSVPPDHHCTTVIQVDWAFAH